MDDYVVCVRSADRQASSAGAYDYSVNLPPIPEGNYKCTVRFTAAALSSNIAYGLQLYAPEIVRCLNTNTPGVLTPPDKFITVMNFNGQGNTASGICFFNGAPSTLAVKLIVLSSGAVATSAVVENAFILELERLQ
jgi:hypothetical protein